MLPYRPAFLPETLKDWVELVVLNAVLWALRTGAPWHDLPNRSIDIHDSVLA